MKSNDNNPIIIVMDIDDFITTMDIRELRKNNRLDPVHHRKENFIKLSFDHQQQHYEVENLLTPGCAEFLRFLFDHENVRPAFFSAGIDVRNVNLAQNIVQMLIDTGGNPNWINLYDVYSREDCFDTTRFHDYSESDISKKFQPKNFFGNYKKDIRMIHYGREKYKEMYRQTFKDPSVLLPNQEKDEQILKNIVLVEEDSSYLFPGQEKNFLLCPTYNHPYPYPINYQGEDTPYKPGDWHDRFKSGNTIFYAAGVLNRALERHASEGLPIPEILWQEQGSIWIDKDRLDERYPINFFTEGREILRKYNSELNFVVAASSEEDS
ncbi:hypothetical protein MHK_000930 [Candidatus Magnetomorum sp. HK-1]|nr:hypothetical protein MHK_000930 [Candidatus Magnetomorum sp. HK-1]